MTVSYQAQHSDYIAPWACWHSHAPNVINSSRVLQVPEGALQLSYVALDVARSHDWN
jgi:hypothetical protein